MINKVHGLFFLDSSGNKSFLPIEYTELDDLVCSCGGRELTVPFDADIDPDDQFTMMLSLLEREGISPLGCYNCRFFTRSGCMGWGSSTVGYCLHEKEGQPLVPPVDLTTLGDSCDAYEWGGEKGQEACLSAWRVSRRA
jgi:hypothetical protein